jgi:hypothetical protein
MASYYGSEFAEPHCQWRTFRSGAMTARTVTGFSQPRCGHNSNGQEVIVGSTTADRWGGKRIIDISHYRRAHEIQDAPRNCACVRLELLDWSIAARCHSGSASTISSARRCSTEGQARDRQCATFSGRHRSGTITTPVDLLPPVLRTGGVLLMTYSSPWKGDIAVQFVTAFVSKP